MAKAKVTGIDAFVDHLEDIDARAIVAKGLYAGAGILADEIRAGVEALPERKKYGSEKHPVRGVTASEKKALLDGLGITHFRRNGNSVQTTISFDGYNEADKTKAYPKGKAVAMIARSVESGTSWLTKTPFIQPAVRRAKAAALAAIEEQIEKEIK